MVLKILAAGAASVLLSAAAGAVTVPDSSFETPATTGYVTRPTVSGVVFTGGAGVWHNGSAFGFNAAPDGTQGAFLNNVGSISLSLSDLIVGQTYQVTFAGSARPGNWGVEQFQVSFNGTQIGDYAISSTAFADYTTTTFVALSNIGTLLFNGGSVNAGKNNNVALDNIRLGTVPTNIESGVPEAATWAMMLGGFGVIGAGMRRRRKPVVQFG